MGFARCALFGMALVLPVSSPRPAPVLTGWYSSDQHQTLLATYGQAGARLVEIPDAGFAPTSAYLATAQRYHIRVLLEVDGANLTHLQAQIIAYRAQLALYGWYLWDEPEYNGVPASRVIAAYHTVKQLDRRHPVAVIFTTDGCQVDPAYYRGVDLVMYDEYPFYADNSDTPLSTVLADYRSCIRLTRQHHKQGPIIVQQAFGNGMHDGPYFTWRDPTEREQQALFDDARALGVPAILFFSDTVADATVWRNTLHVLASSRSSCLPSRSRCGVQTNFSAGRSWPPGILTTS